MLKTRTISQSEVFCLALNSIWANAEQSSLVAVASSEASLMSYYLSQMPESPEIIGAMRYTFKPGPLGNCNPLYGRWSHISQCLWGRQGWFSEWVDNPVEIRADVLRVDF